MTSPYDELLEKYKCLLEEAERLRLENRRLKAELLGVRPEPFQTTPSVVSGESDEKDEVKDENVRVGGKSPVTLASDASSKVRLFMSLFRGRSDVYAKRWENERKGTSGYAPVCLNQWRKDLCGKPKRACAACGHRSFEALSETVIEDHLRGISVVGVYPMLPDETCWFLAMDFDEGEWEKDIAEVRKVCRAFGVPVAVERSRSGKGGHVWFFFDQPVAAVLARRFGSVLLTVAMERRHEIRFKSYDRLFPSQDTLVRGGFGNLIALPLQKAARAHANSEFVDEQFRSYPDQWVFLSEMERLSEDRVQSLIAGLGEGHELGELKAGEEEEKPWETPKPRPELGREDFPERIGIVRANMLYIPKTGLSQRALNRLKRLASFKNPMFYRHQAMRLSTHGHPRIIACADETEQYLALPRGCEEDLVSELERHGVGIEIRDETFLGNPIDVEFKGCLRDEQTQALDQMSRYHNGILCGTTAFGKTVVAIRLIAEKKVNALILVDKVSLLTQWQERLSEFLIIHENRPDEAAVNPRQMGRKKIRNIIGQIGAGKDTASGIIDIAVMQSLSRKGEVRPCVKNYGMIIADECHHASAFTYEQILKTASASYVYGLTATPARKDGHHPILFMQCGPLRFRDDPKKQAEKRPFDHVVIPRFTSLGVPLGEDEKDVSIQKLYAEISNHDFRDQQIIRDVLKNTEGGRNSLVLTLRTAHVEQLAKHLRERIPGVIALTGGMGRKESQKALGLVRAAPVDKPLVLVSTGHFIGEGFDEPRLDTLFLAMPISWKGTLQQYAGRLHRLFQDKKEVRIYDYVDVKIGMLEKMYRKRLNGYASMGYKIKGDDVMDAPTDIIYDKDNFLSVFVRDCLSVRQEIVLVSPFIRPRRTRLMLDHLDAVFGPSVRITVVTRPKEDFPEKDHPLMQNALGLLMEKGVNIQFRPRIHQKFAIIDQRVVWYGSINLLSYGNSQESMMRIESSNVAIALLKSLADSCHHF